MSLPKLHPDTIEQVNQQIDKACGFVEKWGKSARRSPVLVLVPASKAITAVESLGQR